MKTYFLLIPPLLSFFVTLFLLPSWIRRAKASGLAGKDMNKFDGEEVAESGGITVMAGIICGALLFVALKTFYYNTNDNVIQVFSLLTSVLIVSVIGLVDSMLGWKRGLGKKIRIFLVLFAAIPLMVINAGDHQVFLPFFGSINLGTLYPLFFIPIGIIGASTTFNFLAGYNGLEARQGIILLAALSIACYFTGQSWLSIILLCAVASLFAFLIFNSCPASVFPGDVLTYSIGALVAISAILGNIERFAVFIFIPYIIEVFLKLRGRLKMESFARPNKDGSIDVKYNKIYGLEHLAIKILKKFKNKVYENDVVLLINAFQIIIVVLAFIIFKEGLFYHA